MPKKIVKDPIYQQLNQALCEMIHNGEYQSGDQFLTERQISERYEVSRATANKALSSLVSQGLLEFHKGIGTFIPGRPSAHDLFDARAQEANRKPSTRVLTFKTITAESADEFVREHLNCGKDEPLHYVERLRLLDNVPMLLEKRYIVARFCPDLKKEALLGSLLEVWVDQYNLEITESEERIRAVTIARPEARLLEVSPGTAGMLVIGLGRLKSNEWLYVAQTLYRGDKYEFRKHVTFNPAARYQNAFVLDFQE